MSLSLLSLSVSIRLSSRSRPDGGSLTPSPSLRLQRLVHKNLTYLAALADAQQRAAAQQQQRPGAVPQAMAGPGPKGSGGTGSAPREEKR